MRGGSRLTCIASLPTNGLTAAVPITPHRAPDATVRRVWLRREDAPSMSRSTCNFVLVWAAAMLLATGAERSFPVAMSSAAPGEYLASVHQPELGSRVAAVNAAALDTPRAAARQVATAATTFVTAVTAPQIVDFSSAAAGVSIMAANATVGAAIAPPITMIHEHVEPYGPLASTFFDELPMGYSAPRFDVGAIHRSHGVDDETIGDYYSVLAAGTPIYSIKLTSRITLCNDVQFLEDPYTRIELLDSVVTGFRLRIEF